MTGNAESVYVGRVLSEDDTYLLLEVVKDMDRELRVSPGDNFLHIMFVRRQSDGGVITWIPWAEN